MLDSIGYNFKDTKIPFGELCFAVRVATEENVYAPNPNKVLIEEKDGTIRMTATGWLAGGQIETDGSIELLLTQDTQGIYHITGRAKRSGAKLKAILLFIEGIPLRSFVADSENMPEHIFDEYYGINPLCYPGREATMPLVFAKTLKDEWAFLSKDTKPRKKCFEAHCTPDFWKGPVITLGHYEDRVHRGEELELPEWKIGKNLPRIDFVKERCDDLEKVFGLVPLEKRHEAPWIKQIRLIINFHGEHWTGHVFNRYEDMTRRLKIICEEVDGEQVLAFLPGWDGRYYATYPFHEPSPALGGEEGLRLFLKEAHGLGVHVVAMLGGPNLAVYEAVEQFGLQNAIMKTEHGAPMVQNWCDWDADLVSEDMGYLMNFGEPKFQDFMVEKTRTLLADYNFDGVFLDGAIRYDNGQEYSPIKGIQTYCARIQEEFPEKLLMGEDGYDLIWGSFSLFGTSWQPLGLENAMMRYTRQSYYLAHPDLNGSGGIHEQGWNSDGSLHIITEYTLPVFSVTDGTVEDKEGKQRMKKEFEKLLAVPKKLPPIISI